MLYAPTNIIPSTNSGVGAGTIDATQPLTVQWQINGNSAMVAYQITIYQNDAASTQKYTTGKVTLESAVYGTDYAGNIVMFSANEISAAALSTAGIVNGYANGYKMSITQWWGAGANDYVSQPSAAFFITRATPTISISAIPDPLAEKAYSFTATYTQAQGDTLNWIHWKLANKNDKDNPLADTGMISGTGQLRFDYDGFFSGDSYSIWLEVQTENGIEVNTGWVDFDVNYITQAVGGLISVCQALNRNAVFVSWSSIFAINGTASGAYSITDGKLTLNSGSTVTWDSVNDAAMSFSSPWSVVWKGKITTAGGPMFSVKAGDATLSLIINKTDGIVLYNESTAVYTQAITGGVYGWWTVILTPTNIYVQRIVGNGGLYPSTSLYPSTTIYPTDTTTYTVVTYNGSYSATTGVISEVKLWGYQICEYIWVEDGVLDQATITEIMASQTYEPTWDANTDMLAKFTDGLDAGSLATDGYSVYRLAQGESNMEHLMDLDVSVQEFYDYGAKSQVTYTYYIFASGQSTYLTAPLTSDPITPVFWDWVVLECTKDADGVYHLLNEYSFANNVETSAIGNNNSPSISANFTQYPTVQKVSTNYKSGTLNALIGKVDQYANTYTDTTALVDAIMSLSTSENYKFLKNRKGNVWAIEIQSAISMQTGDKYTQQPQKMALPWVETMNAEGLAIVLTPADTSYPPDNIVNTTVTVDLAHGDAIWNVPFQPYAYGSALALVQITGVGYTPATLTLVGNELVGEI